MPQAGWVQHESRKQTSRKTPKTKHMCTICEMSFLYPSKLKRHATAHDVSASFMCEICGRIFRHLTNLNRHKKDSHASQHGERTKPQCVECGKAFRDRFAIKRHILCHSAETSWLCPTCSQMFPGPGDLHKHKLLEHDNVPMDKVGKHECVICRRWFEDPYMLKRLSVVHTKQRPFVCVLCGKAYSQSGALREHQRKKHQY
ncbi:gene K09228 KRAB domain-containing zinc finger protein [Clonorchis sinensis]|uniref:Gene K09228 KRAB domain-containing zinc finger protein n=1 Tax=Clonorchis sinensis TaxID=79923 RepID=G7YY54_CLOSI|nr:gene K09228 KRAB domain-containing zinc finger protein [Clonorchis sinensis]